MIARMFIEIDTEYGPITNAVLVHLDGKIDDVHKLQYTGSVIYDKIMRDVDKEFKRRVRDGVYRNTIHNAGETVTIQTQGRPECTAPFLI